MKKKIIVLGTVDTKGEQLQFLKERIESRGHDAVIMDIEYVEKVVEIALNLFKKESRKEETDG